MRRYLTIENHVVQYCPDCWSQEELAREYPELNGCSHSSKICEVHFQIRLAASMEQLSATREQAAGAVAKRGLPGSPQGG